MVSANGSLTRRGVLKGAASSALALFALPATGLPGIQPAAADDVPLRQLADAAGLQVGCELTGWWFSDARWQSVVGSQFNLAVMAWGFNNWGVVEPQRGQFDFKVADRLVAFAQRNGMRMRGQPLVSPTSAVTAPWLAGLSPDDLAQALRIEAAFLQQLPARRLFRHIGLREGSEMIVHDETQDGYERRHRGIGAGRPLGSIGGIEDQLPTPDEPCVSALLGNHVEEAPEDRQSQPGTEPTQTRMIRERFIEVVADIPTHRKAEAGNLDQLAFGADAFKEHDEVQLEEDDRIDRWPPAAGIAVGDEIAHESKIEGAFKVPIEMIFGDSGFQGNEDGTMKITHLRWTEH